MPHREGVHSIFKVPSMFAVQIMNVPFVGVQYCDLKVLRVLYLQANPDFQKFITLASNNIFHILYISTRSLKIIKQVFLDPQTLLP